MRLIRLLVILAGTSFGGFARASLPWAVVERAGLEKAVAELPFTWDELKDMFDVVPLGPGAYRTGEVETWRADVVRRIGRRLNDRDGYSLVLVPLIDSRESLPFEGLVLDRHGAVVANLVLRYQTNFTRDASKQLFWNYRTSGHYQTLEGWARRLMAQAIYFSRTKDDDAAVVTLSAEKSLAFEEYVANSRLMVGTFLGERPRPLWTLVDARQPRPLRPVDEERFQRLSAQYPGSRIILAHADRSMQEFCEGKLR